MKQDILVRSLTCFALIAAVAACASSEKSHDSAATTAAARPPSVQESGLVTATATVEAIDLESREVTLRDRQGRAVTLVVDRRVKRLPEVRVGDSVKAEYYVAVAAELRPPTPEELAQPISVANARGRTTLDEAPGAGVARTLKIIATVEALDRALQTVTLKGPRGNSVTVIARNPDNFAKLHVGDTFVVTYTEAMAVSLTKAEPGRN